MKVGILAGGYGTRLAEETEVRPKPMVEIGGHPILWHIMKIYEQFGHSEFVVALGYKGDYIKRFMVDYCSLSANLTVDLSKGEVASHGQSRAPDWKVDLIDTGQQTNTGGRIKRLAPYLGDATFMLTWGDGVSDIDLDDLLEFHRGHGKLITMTAVRPPARFGALEIDPSGQITKFTEKPQIGEGWINGAFFVCEPAIFDYIDGDATQFEKEPLEALAADGQLMAYRHGGFWQCMDTLRDKYLLNSLWDKGNAPWKTWSD
jgi:glucose-1-phosphate cytidylyltransferase